jgi:hypothetical protein
MSNPLGLALEEFQDVVPIEVSRLFYSAQLTPAPVVCTQSHFHVVVLLEGPFPLTLHISHNSSEESVPVLALPTSTQEEKKIHPEFVAWCF